ncbi:hypothetical protein BTVI_143671 [Pitangus sulphuratus]|nr:hypothetical protein BTVI_143671 [Pitangus sulphuratus]
MDDHWDAETPLQPMEEPMLEQLQRESERVLLVGPWNLARVNLLQSWRGRSPPPPPHHVVSMVPTGITGDELLAGTVDGLRGYQCPELGDYGCKNDKVPVGPEVVRDVLLQLDP